MQPNHFGLIGRLKMAVHSISNLFMKIFQIFGSGKYSNIQCTGDETAFSSIFN